MIWSEVADGILERQERIVGRDGMILLGESAALTRIVPIGLIAVGIVWLPLAE